MSRAQRDKGRKAEAEVAAIYAGLRFDVRGLEGTGDHLVIGHGLVIHSEVKRQEVLRLPLWSRQALAETPAGAITIVSYRQNRGQWQAIAPEEQVRPLLEAAEATSGIHYTLREIDGVWWARCDLLSLLAFLLVGADRLKAQEAVS